MATGPGKREKGDGNVLGCFGAPRYDSPFLYEAPPLMTSDPGFFAFTLYVAQQIVILLSIV